MKHLFPVCTSLGVKEEGVPRGSGEGTESRASQVSLDLILIKEGKTIVEIEGGRDNLEAGRPAKPKKDKDSIKENLFFIDISGEETLSNLLSLFSRFSISGQPTLQLPLFFLPQRQFGM